MTEPACPSAAPFRHAARQHVGILLVACIVWLVLTPLCTAGPPNVLLIYTDDQGYGDASCLNPAAKIPTPNLDRIARAGVTFTDAHSSDTVCT